MIKNKEEQKAKLKEKLGKGVDKYYEKLERITEQEDFDINKMEQMMQENQGKLKKALRESNSELANKVEAGEKKTAQGADTF